MKKFLLAASLAVLVFAGCAGGGEANYYAEVSSEELVVFVAEDISGDMSWRDYFDGLQEEGIITYSCDMSWRDYFDGLQEEGIITYSMDGSMLAELNGVSNASDYSSCWMLYSDLTELDGEIYGNAEWGTYDYDGRQLVSCAYGLELMPVIEGYAYAAVYVTF